MAEIQQEYYGRLKRMAKDPLGLYATIVRKDDQKIRRLNEGLKELEKDMVHTVKPANEFKYKSIKQLKKNVINELKNNIKENINNEILCYKASDIKEIDKIKQMNIETSLENIKTIHSQVRCNESKAKVMVLYEGFLTRKPQEMRHPVFNYIYLKKLYLIKD
jgi:superfamily II DNA or RNA helicase